MFDVTGLDDVQVGDEVILFGRQEDLVTADELAKTIGTINYEVVCLLNSRVLVYTLTTSHEIIGFAVAIVDNI